MKVIESCLAGGTSGSLEKNPEKLLFHPLMQFKTFESRRRLKLQRVLRRCDHRLSDHNSERPAVCQVCRKYDARSSTLRCPDFAGNVCSLSLLTTKHTTNHMLL
jgi:hypothetical protein